MRLHIRVTGRVQGIGYRFFVVQAAQKHGLTGWVRNCSNGDVECEAQGSHDRLEKFVAELEHGHSWARVQNIARDPISEKSNEKGYEIVY